LPPRQKWQRGPDFRASIPQNLFNLKIKEPNMAWTKPEFTDMRFGFEVTMYIANR
jgi:pyrroloquinoline quinone biosynthesis protein A